LNFIIFVEQLEMSLQENLTQTSFISTKLSEPVKLRKSVENFKFPPIKSLSIYSCFKTCVEKYGERKALSKVIAF
jgi:hypothetical protein